MYYSRIELLIWISPIKIWC